jgi:hypothetical protein
MRASVPSCRVVGERSAGEKARRRLSRAQRNAALRRRSVLFDASSARRNLSASTPRKLVDRPGRDTEALALRPSRRLKLGGGGRGAAVRVGDQPALAAQQRLSTRVARTLDVWATSSRPGELRLSPRGIGKGGKWQYLRARARDAEMRSPNPQVYTLNLDHVRNSTLQPGYVYISYDGSPVQCFP